MVTSQKTFAETKTDGKWTGDIGATDPIVIVTRWLKSKFGNDLVWRDRLHIPDSYVTNTDYIFVVTEIDDDTINHGCHSVFSNVLLEVIVYERKSCQVAGFLELADKFLAATTHELVGNYGLIKIYDANRTTSRNIQFIEDDFRARAVSLSIDYGHCV